MVTGEARGSPPSRVRAGCARGCAMDAEPDVTLLVSRMMNLISMAGGIDYTP